MAEVIVIGGGLAGLASAAALGGAGHSVRLFEARPFLGGRATSYEVGGSETIDNCQHVLLKCCVNLLDFYERLGVASDIRFYREYVFIEPGGRRSSMRAGILPAPLHFTESFATLKFLNWSEKLAVARGMLAIRQEASRTTSTRSACSNGWSITGSRRAPSSASGVRCWSAPSARNWTASPPLTDFRFSAWRSWRPSNAYEMGVPSVPLGELYRSRTWERLGGIDMRLRTPVERIHIEGGAVQCIRAGGESYRADFYVCALPFERLAPLNIAAEMGLDLAGFTHAPITGIHLWFDRPVIDIAHATLLDRTIQWIFNKGKGRYVQLVVSASHSMVQMPRAEVIALAVRELAEFFPVVRGKTRKGARGEGGSRRVVPAARP